MMPATLKAATAADRCLFCGRPLAVTLERPANLAFLRHLEERPACRSAFDGWRLHMGEDAGGD
jgi:hypothetical protein